MKKLVVLSLLVAAFVNPFYTLAQGLKNLPKVISPSPEASALGRFGDWPVSLYTGVTNIQVPFYTINLRDLSLPVQMSYHASGVKVEDVASWVGTGWALEAGGVITRSVMGVQDDLYTGYVYVRKGLDTLPRIFDARQTKDYGILSKIVRGEYDTEPDQYYYNFGGMSGRLYINSDGSMKSLPVSNLKVVRFPSNYWSSSPEDKYWEIIDDRGITYIFGRDGSTEMTRFMDEDAMINTQTSTAWYLNKIIAPNRLDTIYFNYDDKAEVINLKAQQAYVMPENIPVSNPGITKGVIQSAGYGNVGRRDETAGSGRNIISGKTKLKSITWRDGSIVFYANTVRQDLKQAATLLDSIIIRDNRQRIVKQFEFTYDNSDKRPYLRKIIEHPTTAVKQDYYAFDYYDNLPDRFSNSQDHWGYYNGAYNQSMIPFDPVMRNYMPLLDPFPNADRAATDQAVNGSLKKIKYPTGGSSTFEYEINRYDRTAEPDVVTPGHTGPSYLGTTIIQGINPPSEVITDATYWNDAITELVIDVKNYDRPPEAIDGYLPRFRIYKVNADNSTSLLYDWNAFDRNAESTVTLFPSGGTTLRNLSFSTTVLNPIAPITGTIKVVTEVACLKGGCPTPAVRPSISVSLKYQKWFPPTSEPVAQYNTAGGIRIKSIKSFDQDDQLVTTRNYAYTKKAVVKGVLQDVSSGVLISIPSYYSISRKAFICGPVSDPNGLFACDYTQIRVGTFSAASVAPLGVTQGGYVGYECVTERVSDGTNGKTVYYYSNAENGKNEPTLSGIYKNSSMGAWDLKFPVIDKSYARGLLLQRDVIAVMPDNTDSLVEQEKNVYTLNDSAGAANLITTNYLKVLKMGDSLANCCTYSIIPSEQYANRVHEFAYGYYTAVYPWVTLASKYIMRDGLTQTTNYTYNNYNLQVAKETSTNSKAEVMSTNSRYPVDKVNSSQDPQGVYKSLLDNNIQLPVVEQETFVNNRSVSKTIVNYKDWFGNKKIIKPETIAVSNAGQPSFNAAVYYAYDTYGNILSYGKGADYPTSFMWGYNASYPVLKAEDASPAELYYESFEDGNIAGTITTNGHQGTNAFQGTLRISFTRSNNKNYTLSYWKLNGGKWEFVSQPLTTDNPVLTFPQPVDDVVIAPKGSLQQTYTYQPLVGITSESTPAGLLMKYSYDELGRLVIVRDGDNKILKMIQYKYATPITN